MCIVDGICYTATQSIFTIPLIFSIISSIQGAGDYEAAFSDDENVSEGTGSRSSSFTQDHDISFNESSNKERTDSFQICNNNQENTIQEDITCSPTATSTDDIQEDLPQIKGSPDLPQDQNCSYFYQGNN